MIEVNTMKSLRYVNQTRRTTMQTEISIHYMDFDIVAFCNKEVPYWNKTRLSEVFYEYRNKIVETQAQLLLLDGTGNLDSELL